MSAAFLSINGVRADSATLRVPFAGRWIVDVDYNGSDVPSGAAKVVIGELVLVGTISPDFTGSFAGQVKARVVAGAGGWGKTIPARSYHDDGGVRRSTVLAAIARDAGETLDASAAADKTRMRVDFTRDAERARDALDGVLGLTPWRVDFDGVTRYGDWPVAVLGAGVELLQVEPRTKVLTFGAPDPSGVPIGARVTDVRLGGSIVVRELEASFKSGAVRVMAWGTAA